MKILFICGADQKYGTPSMLRSIVSSLSGHELTYIVVTQKYGDINRFCDEYHIKNVIVPYQSTVYGPCSSKIKNRLKKTIKKFFVSLFNFYAIHKAAKLIDMKNIDLIHTNMEWEGFGMMISKKYNIPNITHIRDLFDAHYNVAFLYKRQIQYMNQNTRQFIAISGAVENYWIQLGIDRKKLCVVYDGVYSQDIPLASHRSDETIKIVMCGGLSEGKGHIQLLKAAKLLRDRGICSFHIDFYGDGKKEYKDFLKNYISEWNLTDFISMKGYISNVAILLHQYDIGVICSKAEGFGLATVEYMLAGICAVVSNTGANTELIKEGETGFLYEYNHPKELAKQLEMAIKKPVLRKKLGGNARQEALKRFSVEKSVEKLLHIYQEVYNNNK